MLSEFLTRFKWKLLSASVRGPGHIRNNLPNQDSAFVGFIGKYLLVMVCDGLGSHKHSEFGAKILCQIFPNCFKEWSKVKPHNFDDFLRLLQSKWLMHVRKFGVDSCGCTCQFAMLNSKGKGWVAQLGDGMTLIRHNKQITKFTEPKEGFVNETMAMSDSYILPYWRTSKIDLSNQGDRLLIMTDGISEDILPQSEDKFISIFDMFFIQSKRAGQKKLTKELINWPTPHHTDDKTIVAIERR
jgi:serine/threonine protein phosphatase PrpC